MKRVMCVYFPKWPLQRLCHEQPELRNEPVVFGQSGTARRPQVVWCSELAARHGIRPGMPLAEALAIEPGLQVHEEDPARDRQLLEQRADGLGRYSPLVGLEEGSAPQSLLADVTGCAALFHGEDRLLERAMRQLRTEGWIVRLAIADTLGAAWALAHHVPTPRIVPPGETEPALRPLPIAALRLSSEVLHLLSELGIDHVGQLLALPRADIPARFGGGVLQRLDQVLGRLPELILPCRAIPDLQAQYRFEFATDRLEVLQYVLAQLTSEVHALLQSRRWGARHLECCLHHETAPPVRLEVRLFRPSDSRRHLESLLRIQLEQIRVTEPVCTMDLRVVAAEPLPLVQTEWVDMEQTQARRELSTLIDQLSNQLGREAVTRPTLVPDPQPEYACRFKPVVSGAGSKGAKPHLFTEETASRTAPGLAHRPLWLWPKPARIEVMRTEPGGPPTRFRWDGTEYQVKHTRGPERIETGWWRGRDIHRDYYMVTTEVGTRFWLFLRRDDGCWFLHGCFD